MTERELEQSLQNKQEFFDLMQKNPAIQVVPMVDTEVVSGDEYGYWMGSIGKCGIREYIVGEERMYYKDDGDTEELLSEVYGYEEWYAMSEAEAEDKYQKLPWKKGIFVYIETP